MPASNPQKALEEDLRDKIAAGDVVVIVGAGLSGGATKRHKTADWRSLLEHGLEHLDTIG